MIHLTESYRSWHPLAWPHLDAAIYPRVHHRMSEETARELGKGLGKSYNLIPTNSMIMHNKGTHVRQHEGEIVSLLSLVNGLSDSGMDVTKEENLMVICPTRSQ